MLLLDSRGDRAGATREGDDGETWRPDEEDAEATAAVPFRAVEDAK